MSSSHWLDWNVNDGISLGSHLLQKSQRMALRLEYLDASPGTQNWTYWSLKSRSYTFQNLEGAKSQTLLNILRVTSRECVVSRWTSQHVSSVKPVWWDKNTVIRSCKSAHWSYLIKNFNKWKKSNIVSLYNKWSLFQKSDNLKQAKLSYQPLVYDRLPAALAIVNGHASL